MFEIGDKVMVNDSDIRGIIVDFYFDEGSVWVIEVDDTPGVELECCDSELAPYSGGCGR